MKNLFFIAVLCICQSLYSQPSLSGTYSVGTGSVSRDFFLTKFTNAGYKYVTVDYSNSTISIYNVNHTAFKTFTFAAGNTAYTHEIFLLTDQLFNKNNNIEYAMLNYPSFGYPSVTVRDETGAVIFYEDSAETGPINHTDLLGKHGIIYNGVNYQWIVPKHTNSSPGYNVWKVYDLPGSLPCISCSTFSTPGVVTSNSGIIEDPIKMDPAFFPNPVHDQLKLKYTLPAGFKSAEIIITDLQGKTIEKYQIGSAFDFIYIPSDYNNGLYLYSLVVDGVAIKTEKIIIAR